MSLDKDIILQELLGETGVAVLSRARVAATKELGLPHWQTVRELFKELPNRSELEARGTLLTVEFNGGAVTVRDSGGGDCLTVHERSAIRSLIASLMPWRKGPFSIFNEEIDAEWRSDLKWSRIVPHLPSLQGKRVLDIGCGNGYYMLRLLGETTLGEPALVLGIDPSAAFFYQFQLFSKYIANPTVQFELLGLDGLQGIGEQFDLILCLGVIYHQRDPLAALQQIKKHLAPGGTLVLESQCIPGREPIALFPKHRYAKARNVYFVPTAACLATWAERVGFEDVRVVSDVRLTSEEQRRSPLMGFESLDDFLDPKDRSLTVEGYPAPWRSIVVCKKAERSVSQDIGG